MSNIVICEIPALGHINPMLNLASQMVSAGHVVFFYTTNRYEKIIVEKEGIIFKDIGKNFRILDDILAQEGGSLRFLFEQANIGMASLEYLLESIRSDSPDCLIFDFMCVWGKQIAEILKIKSISFFPSFVLNMDDMRKGHISGGNENQIKKYLNSFTCKCKLVSQEYGIKEIGFENLFFNDSELNIVCTTRSFQPNAEKIDNKFVFVGPFFNNPVKLVDQKKKQIYISMGTVYGKKDNFLIYSWIETFGGIDYKVILIGEKKFIVENFEVPQNFEIYEYVNQIEILSESMLFITNGGFNSVSEAIASEIPMIVIPQGADNYSVASRVSELRIGEVLLQKNLNKELLYEKAMKLIRRENIDLDMLSMLGKEFRCTAEKNNAVKVIKEYIQKE